LATKVGIGKIEFQEEPHWQQKSELEKLNFRRSPI
jgi:hypothetical protein